MQFFIRLIPPRSDFLVTLSPEESAVMSDHLDYLRGVLKHGKLILAGPVIDPSDTYAVVILEAESEAEAQQIMEKDPCVKANLMRVELQRFRLSLVRGLPAPAMVR